MRYFLITFEIFGFRGKHCILQEKMTFVKVRDKQIRIKKKAQIKTNSAL